MSHAFTLVVAFLLLATTHGQAPFSGRFESEQNGRKLITIFKNENGTVTGTSTFADESSVKTFYRGLAKGNVLTGKLKDNVLGLDIKFTATDNGESVVLEMQGALLELLYTKEDRTVVLVRSEGEGSKTISISPKLDSRLIGTWVHRQSSNSNNGSANTYEGLKLLASGKCQQSSMVVINGAKNGSLDNWQGNGQWYTQGDKLYISENGFTSFQGIFTINGEAMLITSDGQRKYYTKR